MNNENQGEIREGLIVEGTVKSIADYGVFVIVGSIEGLLHVTDMSWGEQRIHPAEMFRVGDEIKVKVLKFDSENKRLSLGIKQLKDDPWITFVRQFEVGKTVHGKVVKLVDYGAYLEVAEGVEGLVHVSDMSLLKRVYHPSEVLKMGEELDVLILGIDLDMRRMTLGIKQIG